MFRVHSSETDKTYRLVIAGLLTLSVMALAVTIWIMDDLLREQEIVAELIDYLPPQGDAEAEELAEELAGELRWQFRLSILVVLNLVVTGFAVLLLWRGYRSSQESLRDFKAMAGDILNSMDLAIITTNVGGEITSINGRGIELLGLSGEFVGRPLRDLCGEISLEDFRQESRGSETGDEVRDFHISVNGTTKILRAFCQPLNDREQFDIGNVVQLRDVTERVLMEDRIRRMERYMGLGSLAAGLQHEIKNPLAALSLHVQLLEEELSESETSRPVQEMLSVIKTEVARVGGVLEGFRDFASIHHLNLAEVDLAKLIDRQVKLIHPQAQKEQIEIRVKLPTKSLPEVRLDRVRMEQVLLNLLINAMEAISGGGVIEIAVEAEDDHKPGRLRIAISDTGPGIPPDLQSRIFDPYFTTKSEGTGMGLALCDKIVRQHHGSLDFRNTETGAVFVVTLPVQ